MTDAAEKIQRNLIIWIREIDKTKVLISTEKTTAIIINQQITEESYYMKIECK